MGDVIRRRGERKQRKKKLDRWRIFVTKICFAVKRERKGEGERGEEAGRNGRKIKSKKNSWGY